MNNKYSPKNLANYLRLGLVAATFFKTGEYVVDCKQFMEYSLLREVRECPEKFNLEIAEHLMEEREEDVKLAFDSRDQKNDLTFDENYANFVLSKTYKPYLL